MQIRERRDDDLVQLVPVAARVHAADQYPIYLPDGDFERFLTRPQPLTSWVAIRCEEVIGHVALNASTSPPVMQLVEDLVAPGPPAVFVARLLVDPGARRYGVGRRLLEHARRSALASGYLPFLDVVNMPTATAAMSLYRQDGWQEVGRVSFELVGQEIDEVVFRAPSS